MLSIPNKGFFESKDSYLKKVTKLFETSAKLDPINAHYAAIFYINSRTFKMGDYRKGNGAELIVAAIRGLLNESGDVTKPGNIKEMIDKMKRNT